MSDPRPIVLGVAGGSGSGKTTVVDRILEEVGEDRIAVIRHDRYYHDLADRPFEERAAVNFDHPHSLDNELFGSHLDELVAGRPIEVPGYDFATHRRTDDTEAVEPRPVVLAEGILIFADPTLRDRMDIKVYVDAEADLRVIRRMERDIQERGRSVESVLEQYQATVRPMHLEFVEPSKRWADVIIPRGGRNDVAIDMVVARVERLLHERQG